MGDKISLEYSDKNEYTHMYTAVIKPDGTYEVFFDMESKSKGSLVEGWDFPKPTIDDPESKKPSDWVDESMMADPEDKKPEGYDDIPSQIPDPDASKPDDWDDEDDGEWEPPMIDNPEYKGPWTHPKIPNPDYVYDDKMYAVCPDGCSHIGFEIWQVKSGTIFDDIIITDSMEEAQKFAEDTFFAKKDGE